MTILQRKDILEKAVEESVEKVKKWDILYYMQQITVLIITI